MGIIFDVLKSRFKSLITGKKRLNIYEVHSDAYIYRCIKCNNDFVGYSKPEPCICEDCDIG